MEEMEHKKIRAVKPHVPWDARDEEHMYSHRVCNRSRVSLVELNFKVAT